MSYNLSASIDYNRQKIYVTATTPDAANDLSNANVADLRVLAVNSKGILISNIASLSETNSIDGQTNISASATLDFGIGVYSNSTQQQSGRIFVNADPMHGFGIFSGATVKTGIYTPSSSAISSPIPLVIEDGESVFRGKITSVTGKVYVGYSGDSYNMPLANSTDFAGYKMYMFSGAGSGNYSTVSRTGQPGYLYMDTDMSAFVGGYFKLMPVINVTGNSSWSYTYAVSNLYTERNIPTGLGNSSIPLVTISEYLPDGSASGFPWTVNTYVKGLTTYGGMRLGVSKNQWGKAAEVGDLIRYRQASDSSNMNGLATVYYVDSTSNANSYILLVYPSGDPSNLEGFTDGIHVRRNRGRLLSYPGFDETINIILYNASTGPQAAQTVQTPSARLEVSANDYDSAYGTIGNVSHFHFGPVVIENGQVLDHPNELTFSGSLYNSNPRQLNSDKTWEGRSTITGSASEYLSGNYYRKGIFTYTHDQAFISSEMLTLSAKINYGSIEVKNVLSIPVQPTA